MSARSVLVLSEIVLLALAALCTWAIWTGIKTGSYANKDKPIYMHHDPVLFWLMTGVLLVIILGSLFVAVVILRIARAQ